MKIAPLNLLSHEPIGLEAKIIQSREPTLNGLEGLVVYETKKTIQIYSKGRLKTVPKDICKFSFRLPQGVAVEVDGSRLLARPEDRIKRLRVR